jgi:hypothetical protein
MAIIAGRSANGPGGVALNGDGGLHAVALTEDELAWTRQATGPARRRYALTRGPTMTDVPRLAGPDALRGGRPPSPLTGVPRPLGPSVVTGLGLAAGFYFGSTVPAGIPRQTGELPGGVRYRYSEDESLDLVFNNRAGALFSARQDPDGVFRTPDGRPVAHIDRRGRLHFDDTLLSLLRTPEGQAVLRQTRAGDANVPTRPPVLQWGPGTNVFVDLTPDERQYIGGLLFQNPHMSLAAIHGYLADFRARHLNIPDTFTLRLGNLSALGFQAPPVFVNNHHQLTNGIYTLDQAGMAPHMTGSLTGGKSQFFFRLDAGRITLAAAAFADMMGLWGGSDGSTAKVWFDAPIGIHARTGRPTNILNIYRTSTGFVHATPGSPDD